MTFDDMIATAKLVRTKGKPRTRAAGEEYAEELTGDLEQLIEHLEGLLEKAQDITSKLTDFEDEDTPVSEFSNIAKEIREQGQELEDMLNGIG